MLTVVVRVLLLSVLTTTLWAIVMTLKYPRR